MNTPAYFDAKKTLNLFGLNEYFNFIKNLYIKKKLPNVLMLSGKKGSGKSTLINHLMFFVFDKNNYNEKSNMLEGNSTFHYHFINNIYANIIYLSGSDFKNIKIEDIRNLKKKIFQSSISDKPRFIIFDDVELFNNNSLNALLKIIEEPTKNNYFFLINNKSKSLLETIKSRCIDIKINLNEEKRQKIISSLVNEFDINVVIDPISSKLSPGHFIKFNYIYADNKISTDQDFIKNLEILMNLFKKNKDQIYIEIIFFLTDSYFNDANRKNLLTNKSIIHHKKYIFENINKFFIYNLNQNTLLNNINNKINNE